MFDKKRRYDGRGRRERVPWVGIQKAGMLSLNAPAFEALGEPEAVVLLFDPEEKVVGFRASPATDPRAFPLRKYNRRSSAYLVSGRTFLKHYGVDHSTARRYSARMVGDVLAVPLREKDAGAGPRDGNGPGLRAVS